MLFDLLICSKNVIAEVVLSSALCRRAEQALTQTEIVKRVKNNHLEFSAKKVPSGTRLTDILAAFKRRLKTTALLTVAARCHILVSGHQAPLNLLVE